MKIAINGFGRIGRLFLRKALQENFLEVVAINDLGDAENLAYLTKYDTVYGEAPFEVRAEGGALIANGKRIAFSQEKDATKLPWGTLGIDVVVESTGVFDSFEKAQVHLAAGAKRVVITAPAKDEDSEVGKTAVVCVNEGAIKDAKITSNGSCTTNAIATVMKILEETVGVQKALLNTTHAMTGTQSIVDSVVKGKDFRRGRAAGHNMGPSTTGAAIAMGRVMPSLQGKFDGVAVRVPTISGSLADITFVAKRKTSVEEINDIFKKAAADPNYSRIFSCTNEQLVSSDILGKPFGAIVDLGFTKVVDGDLVKVLSWYDNEMGYVHTLVEHLKEVNKYM